MKLLPRMLSISWMSILKWVGIFPYAQHARKLVTCWLSMRKNRLLVGWACVKIGDLLAELAQKLITCWLSTRENWENWLLVGWACTKIDYLLAEHARKLVTRSLSMRENWENWLLVGWPFTKISYSLAEQARKLATRLVLRPLSHGSAPCLPSSPGPCPYGSPPCPLSFVLRPLYTVYCPLSVALFHYSCHLLLCFPSSIPPSLVLCPLSFILARMRNFLNNIPFSAELFVEFIRALQQKHKRIPGSGLLNKKHQQTLKTLWQIPSKLNICQKSVGNFLEFSMWVQLY